MLVQCYTQCQCGVTVFKKQKNKYKIRKLRIYWILVRPRLQKILLIWVRGQTRPQSALLCDTPLLFIRRWSRNYIIFYLSSR